MYNENVEPLAKYYWEFQDGNSRALNLLWITIGMRSLYHKATHSLTVLFQWHQWGFSIFSNSFIEVYLFIYFLVVGIIFGYFETIQDLTMRKLLKMTRCQVFLQEQRDIWGGRQCPLDRHKDHWKNRGGALGQRSAHFSCEGTENTYFRPCGSYDLYCNYSTLVLYHENSHPQHINERKWIHSNRTLFIDTECWNSYHFHVPRNIYWFFFPAI